MSQGFYGFPNILGLLRATNLRLTGKAGATAGAGLAGGTTSDAPVSGQFDVGDAVIAQNGHLLICTVAGSPGTWVDAASGTGSLAGESDVSLSSPSAGQLLQYNGSAWVNYTVPACEATQSGSYSLTTGTAAMIPLALTTYDQGTATAQHDNVTNNTRLVCRVAGVYAVSGMLTIATNATGVRELFLAVNGGTGNAAWVLYAPTGADQYYMSAAGLWKFAVGDYLELQAQQNSSGNLNAANARLSWARVG